MPLMPVKINSAATTNFCIPIVQSLVFSMHDGKLIGPFDGFSTSDWDHIRDIATKKAVNFMVDHLSENYDISAEDAYMLCSLVGDLKIAEVVDVPNMLVTMHFPKSILTQL